MARGSITSAVGRFFAGAFGITGVAAAEPLLTTAALTTGVTLGGPAALGILGIVAAFSGGVAIYRGRKEARRDSKVDDIRTWLEQLVKQHGSLQKALAGLEDDAPLPPGVARDRIRAVRAVFAGGIEGIEARLAEHGDFARCIRDSMAELEASDEQFRMALSNLIDFAVDQQQISKQQLDMLSGLDAKVDAVLAGVIGISRVQVEHGEVLAELLDHVRSAKMSEEEIREKIREEIASEYHEKLAAERDARVAAERAAESVMRVRDMPGIVEALREKGGQAIIDALLAGGEVSEADQIHRHRAVAEWAYLVGNIEQAEKSLRILLAYNADDLDAIIRMGHLHQLRGELPDAEGRYRRVLTLAGNDQSVQAVAYGNLGTVKAMRGDLAGAEAMIGKALEAYMCLCSQEGMAIQYGNLGGVMFRRGDLDGAEAMYRNSLQIHEHMSLHEGIAKNYGNIGLVLGARGDLTGAERMFRKALEIDERLSRLEGMAANYGNLGIVMFTRGDLDGAEAIYREALEINKRLGRQEGMSRNYGSLGLVMATRGDVSAARAMWRKARGLYEQIGMKHEVEKMDQWLDGLGGEGTRE